MGHIRARKAGPSGIMETPALLFPMTTLNTDQVQTEAKLNGFEPLSVPLFRDLWLASIVSNLGGWMQDTAGTWLMTVLTPSPLLIALMQTAASLPVVILGLLCAGGAGFTVLLSNFQGFATALQEARAGRIEPVWRTFS